MTLRTVIEYIKAHRIKTLCLTVLCVLSAAYIFCLPADLFEGTSFSTVVTSREGELLGARIADDGQWRFPPSDTVPERFSRCLIEFEDRYFRLHPGVNPVSAVRALKENIRPPLRPTSQLESATYAVHRR